jgi:hypothetical protein
MDYGMIHGAVTSLKAAADIAVALGNLKTLSEVQAKAIELQQIILSAQSSALTAQSEQFGLLEEIRDLKAAVGRLKAWDEQRQRYSLVAPWQGAATYALRRDRSNGEPPHWICSHCYEAGKKSILNDLTLTPAKGPHTLVLNCAVCKAQVPSGWSGGSIQRKYAEDIPQV